MIPNQTTAQFVQPQQAQAPNFNMVNQQSLNQQQTQPLVQGLTQAAQGYGMLGMNPMNQGQGQGQASPSNNTSGGIGTQYLNQQALNQMGLGKSAAGMSGTAGGAGAALT